MKTPLPEAFLTETRATLGAQRFDAFLSAFDETPPVSIRLNRAKGVTAPAGEAQEVPWCADGFYLAGRLPFTFDPLLHAGCYYVQEAASMFIGHVATSVALATGVAAGEPLSVLDLCAAPGGKSTLLRGCLPPGSLLVSNEPVVSRAQVLAENMQKWGLPRCVVTNSLPRDFSRARLLFDAVLCDVPCSGEGMFRKDEATIGEWSLEAVARLVRLQRDIVGEAWRCLSPGGLLIYSTCTLNVHENEENVAWMVSELGAQPLPVDTPTGWHIVGSLLAGLAAPVYRFVPGVTRSEGLFVAVMRKPDGAPHARPHGEGLAASAGPPLARLKMVWDGQTAPVKKGKTLIPAHAHALRADRAWTSDHVAVELTWEQAVAYLRREALRLPPDVPTGFCVVCFKGHALGFVKNIGARANNLYPDAWRIRSTHVPAGYEPVVNPRAATQPERQVARKGREQGLRA